VFIHYFDFGESVTVFMFERPWEKYNIWRYIQYTTLSHYLESTGLSWKFCAGISPDDALSNP
jgi:hypothetical protein